MSAGQQILFLDTQRLIRSYFEILSNEPLSLNASLWRHATNNGRRRGAQPRASDDNPAIRAAPPPAIQKFTPTNFSCLPPPRSLHHLPSSTSLLRLHLNCSISHRHRHHHPLHTPKHRISRPRLKHVLLRADVSRSSQKRFGSTPPLGRGANPFCLPFHQLHCYQA